MKDRHSVIFSLLVCLLAGCASTVPRSREYVTAHSGAFEEVALFDQVEIVDFRKDDLNEFRRRVRPGDLVVNYMRLGRVPKKKQWLFALLPYGHSMVVLDPSDPNGLFESRFSGARRIAFDDLKTYSYNVIYRLRDPSRLNLDRLREFADEACRRSKSYSFKSWVAINDNMRPNAPGEISRSYTCSTMVVAAYHYAGVTLDIASLNKVITPLSVAAAAGEYNEFAAVGNKGHQEAAGDELGNILPAGQPIVPPRPLLSTTRGEEPTR